MSSQDKQPQTKPVEHLVQNIKNPGQQVQAALKSPKYKVMKDPERMGP